MSQRPVFCGAVFAVFSGYTEKEAVRPGALQGPQLPCPELGWELILGRREPRGSDICSCGFIQDCVYAALQSDGKSGGMISN